MRGISESEVEDAALEWLAGLGWSVVHGPDLAPDAPGAERADYGEVVLERRLRDALARLNPGLPTAAREDAFRKLIRPEGATLAARNRAFHRMATDGVTVEYRDAGGAIRGAQAATGNAEITPVEMRDGIENLQISEERWAEIGLPGFAAPIEMSCENHAGPRLVAVQQWDAAEKSWNLVSDFMEADKDVVDTLIAEDSAAYAAENGIAERCN